MNFYESAALVISLGPATFNNLTGLPISSIDPSKNLAIVDLLTGGILPGSTYIPAMSSEGSGSLQATLKPGEGVWGGGLNGGVFGIGILDGNGNLLRELEGGSRGDPSSTLSCPIGAVTQVSSIVPTGGGPQATITNAGSAVPHLYFANYTSSLVSATTTSPLPSTTASSASSAGLGTIINRPFSTTATSTLVQFTGSSSRVFNCSLLPFAISIASVFLFTLI